MKIESNILSFNLIKVGEDNSTLENDVFPGFLIIFIFYYLEGEGLFSSAMSTSHLAKCKCKCMVKVWEQIHYKKFDR